LATANILTRALIQKDIADADNDTRNKPRKKMAKLSNVFFKPGILKHSQWLIIPEIA